MVLPRIITANEVHFTIQEINKTLLGYNDAITILSIAGVLQVNSHEIQVQLDTLAALYYLKYTDRRNVMIKLTFNGRNTLVPMFFALI